MQQTSQQQNARKVQQKIKLMMKQKKMQKLASQRQLLTQKTPSLYGMDKLGSRLEQFSYKNKRNFLQQNRQKQQPSYNTYSSKRINSIVECQDKGISTSFSAKQGAKKFLWPNKQLTGLHQSSNIKKAPSAQKTQSTQQQINRQSSQKLKRPSSVINKSTRATTSRSRRTKQLPVYQQKQMQQKIRHLIPKCFQNGMKLQRYSQGRNVNLSKEYSMLFSEEINVLRLINYSRKYYSMKVENEEQMEEKLANGVEREIIQMLKKKKDKESVISNCDHITSQIARLIDTRLSALTSTKSYLA